MDFTETHREFVSDMERVTAPTGMIRTDAESMMWKVTAFREMVVSFVEDSGMDPLKTSEANVLLDMMGMIGISLKCRHRPAGPLNRSAHERPHGDLGQVPSHAEILESSFNMSVGNNVHVRSNPIICNVMSNFSCIFDVCSRAQMKGSKPEVILCLSMDGIRHMMLTSYLFTIMTKVMRVSNVEMLMSMDQKAKSIFSVKRAEFPHVLPVPPDGVVRCVYEVRRNFRKATVTLMHTIEATDMEISLISELKVDYMSLTITIDSMQQATRVQAMCKSLSMITEIVPLSNFPAYTIRVTNSLQNTNRLILKSWNKVPDYWLTSRVASFTNRIRPMNLAGMCYDCRIAYEMMIEMARAQMNYHESIEVSDLGDEWVDAYAGVITWSPSADAYEEQ